MTCWLYHFISQLITWILAGKNTLSIDREADVFGNCYMTFLNIHNMRQKIDKRVNPVNFNNTDKDDFNFDILGLKIHSHIQQSKCLIQPKS